METSINSEHSMSSREDKRLEEVVIDNRANRVHKGGEDVDRRVQILAPRVDMFDHPGGNLVDGRLMHDRLEVSH